MKRLAVLLIVLLMAVGCVTTHQIPAGCETSIVWKYSPWSQVALKTMVDGIHILAGTQHGPASYAIIKESAQQLIVMLSGGPLAYDQIQSAPQVSAMLISTLGLIFAPGQVIGDCDRAILIDYLKMI